MGEFHKTMQGNMVKTSDKNTVDVTLENSNNSNFDTGKCQQKFYDSYYNLKTDIKEYTK